MVCLSKMSGNVLCKAIFYSLAFGVMSELVYQIYRYYNRKREKRYQSSISTEVLFFPDQKVACKDHFTGTYGCVKDFCRFTHNENSLSRLYKYLTSTKRSLEVCVFVITCSDLADLLIKVHKRGVKVRVITDNEQVDVPGSQIWKLRREGITVRTDNSSFFMHHKFVVIDRSRIINGSFNWTRQAITGNQENLIITNNKEIVKLYISEFEKLWSNFDPKKLTTNTSTVTS